MSIQEHLNKIRNAIKGSEVRESIAKGIETAYDDASEKDNANMEVKIARGTHPNLRSRLEEVDNKQQQTTAQLAQKATKGEIGTSDLNKNKTQFDASWFSDQFLEDLSTNEIITTFLEDGSVTTDKLANKAVELEKLGFVEVERTNLANPDEFVENSYISPTAGNVMPHDSDVLTGYIPVKKGHVYTSSSPRNKAFYDKNKEFVSGYSGGETYRVFTSPIDGYLRTSFAGTDNQQMVVEGDTLPDKKVEYSDYTVEILDKNFLNAIHEHVYDKSKPKLSGIKWNVLGDSITAGSLTTKSYVEYIEEETGIIARNYGVSGNTIAHIPDHWAGDGMSIRYAEMDDDVDIITVFGGTNDYGHGLVEIGSWNDGTNTTLYGGTQTLIEGLINKYPTKKIGFILPLPRHAINGNNTLGDYVAVIKEVCDRYSVPTLDLYHNSGIMPGLDVHKTALIPDGTHPNAEGHRIIANKIQTFLESL